MTRRDYPYRKRDADQLGKFIANIITLPLLLLFTFLKTSSTNDCCESNNSNNIYVEPIKLNPKSFKIKYFILGILSLLCPIISFWTFIEFDKGLLIIIGCIQIFIDFLLSGPDVKDYILFDKFRLNSQIQAIRVVNIWSICIFLIQLILNILVLIFIIRYDEIYYNNRVEGFFSGLETFGVIICISLGLIVCFIGLLLSIGCYMRMYEDISHNDSYKMAIEKVTKINVKLLFELHNPNNYGCKFELANGSTIECVNNPDWKKCGFIFTKKNGNKKKYNLNKYAPSLIDYIKDGQRLFKEIAEDINKDLSIYDVESIV